MACPEIAVLIKEMWQTDFRARPAMKDVVVRLEVCTFGGCEAINLEEDTEDRDESADQTKTEDVLRAEIKALRAEQKLELKALRAENRHENAALKAALLSGTSMENEDDVGILGGMFICTSN